MELGGHLIIAYFLHEVMAKYWERRKASGHLVMQIEVGMHLIQQVHFKLHRPNKNGQNHL